jgi:hypothetical protein
MSQFTIAAMALCEKNVGDPCFKKCGCHIKGQQYEVNLVSLKILYQLGKRKQETDMKIHIFINH